MDTIVRSAADIGLAVRRRRMEDGLTLAQASGLCNVNYRFLWDLENGKKTVRFDKVMQVLACFGFGLNIKERTWQDERKKL